jgi:hypothetical protein
VIGLAAAGVEGAALAQQPGGSAQAPPDAAKMEEARRHFERGIGLLRDPEGEKVEAAYLEFKVAYELSRSPRVLGNIGYCAMRMERNTESVDAYREYLKLVPDVDPAERAQIKQDVVTMTEGAASVTTKFSGPGAWTLVDERVPARGAEITNVYEARAGEAITILVHPGRHTMHAKVNGDEQGRWEFEAVGGGSLSHGFEPKPAAAAAPAVATSPDATSKPVSRAPQIALMGIGGALLVAGGVTGIVALSKTKSIEKECPNNLCPADSSYKSDVDSARTMGTVTDVLLITGAVAAASGAIWFALTPSHREEGGTTVSGACLPGSCGVTLRGSF